MPGLPAYTVPAYPPGLKGDLFALMRCLGTRLGDCGFDRTLTALKVPDQHSLNPLLHCHLSSRELARFIQHLVGDGPQVLGDLRPVADPELQQPSVTRTSQALPP